MLDKLDLNKKIILLAITLVLSCTKPNNFATQIDCPNFKTIIVIENISRDEVYAAAQNFLIQKRIQQTKETYTVLTLADGRSITLKDVAPEEFNRCVVIQLPLNRRY